MAEVGGLGGLMDQVALSERDFDLAERVAWVVWFDALAGLDILSRFDPRAIGRHPFRVPDDLARLPLADGEREVFTADADLISLALFAGLPEREAEGRDVDRDPNPVIAFNEWGLFDAAAGE